MALIRYPGSKAKLVTEILRAFPVELTHGALFQQNNPPEYREPFFGAGAIGFAVLESLSNRCAAWLNDKDPGMVALWMAVAWNPWELQDRVRDFQPSADLFYQFKDEDGASGFSMPEVALRKLALHRMSYSGLGYMSGGPLGGRNQSSEYNVACRWNAGTIQKEITRLHKTLRRFEELQITNFDFSQLIADAPENSFVYLDPPYFAKGPQLYRYAMDENDHRRLADSLKTCKAQWVLSYDDHPIIRDLYRWATIRPVEIRYTMGSAPGPTRPKNREILIAA